MLTVCGVILVVAYKLDIPYLRCASFLLPALIGSYIGSRYLSTAEQREKKSFSRRTWILLIIGCLASAALLAWLLDGRLW